LFQAATGPDSFHPEMVSGSWSDLLYRSAPMDTLSSCTYGVMSSWIVKSFS